MEKQEQERKRVKEKAKEGEYVSVSFYVGARECLCEYVRVYMCGNKEKEG